MSKLTSKLFFILFSHPTLLYKFSSQWLNFRSNWDQFFSKPGGSLSICKEVKNGQKIMPVYIVKHYPSGRFACKKLAGRCSFGKRTNWPPLMRMFCETLRKPWKIDLESREQLYRVMLSLEEPLETKMLSPLYWLCIKKSYLQRWEYMGTYKTAVFDLYTYVGINNLYKPVFVLV